MDLSPESWKKIKDIVKCPVCYGMLNDAKFLPCGHTFCQSCLEECHRRQQSTIGMSCPMCKENSTVSAFHHLRAGLSDLPKNLIAEAVGEVLRNRTGNENPETGPEIPLDGQPPAGTAKGITRPSPMRKRCSYLVLFLFIVVTSYAATIVPLTEFLPVHKQLEILGQASAVCKSLLDLTPKIEETKTPETFIGKLINHIKEICEIYECGFTSRPQNPKKGDSLILTCSAIVNGFWNASLIFRNNYDESEITGIMSECDSQPSIGTKICSTVEVTADADILAYSCRLKYPPSECDTKASQNSKSTSEFNEEIICTLPKIYLEVIPSDVSFLCNQMPCGDTASVNDTVTCLGNGYPQPVFDLRIKKLSPEPTPKGVYENRFFLDTTDESGEVKFRGFEDYRIRQKDVGKVEITCNVSNVLGWKYRSLTLEIIGDVLGASESYTTEDYGISKDYLTTSEAPSVLIQCNGFRCEENQTLVVGDEISCIAGGGMSFDRFVLVVNKQTIEGDDKEVKYVLQMADIGDINVECLAYLTSGVPLMRTVPVIVRESKPEQGEAAGDIDLEEAATIVKKPSGKPDSGSAEKEKEVPKVNDEMAAEKSAGDDKPKPSIGSGRESFVLLQLFLAFIAAFVGLGQF